MSTRITSVAAALLVAWNLAGIARAVPITGGTGPGGVGTTDGLSNLNLWLSPESGLFTDTAGTTAATTGGDPIARWDDASGNGNNVTQGTAARQATLSVGAFNGLAAVNFDQSGTPDVLAGTFNAAPGTTARTIFIVSQPDESDFGSMIDLSSNGTTFGKDYGITPEVAVRVSGNQVFDTGLSFVQPSVLTVRNPANAVVGDSGTIEAYIDGGTMLGTDAGLTTDTAYLVDSDGTITELGRTQQGDSNDYDGRISEIAVFDRELNNAEKLIVENALSAKYNIAVANDQYVGDDGGNGDYDRDVFGIGREDASNQLTNSGSAGFGIEATSGITDDGDYILAGHNVPVNGRTEDDIPAELTDRWERVWYVDKTDADDDLDVTLSFDFTDAGLSEPTLFEAKFALLFSDMEPFNFVEIPNLTTTLDGDTVSFLVPAALLADGYYTLGIFTVPEPSTAVLLLLGLVGMTARARRRRAGKRS